MKTLLLTLCFLLNPLAHAHHPAMGNEGPNGGDDIALEFRQAFTSAVARSQAKLPSLYRTIQKAKLSQLLRRTTVLVSDQVLVVERDGIIQESVATNQASPPQIVINRRRWKEISVNQIKEALALHEVASLAGLESTGQYPLSTRYLSLWGLNADPEFAFESTCSRTENSLYQRAKGQFEVGEVSRVDVNRAAADLELRMSACGEITTADFCRVTIPLLTELVAGTKEELKIGLKYQQDVDAAESDLKGATQFCEWNHYGK